MVAGGDDEDAVEVQAVADEDEERHHLLEEAEAGVALAGEGGAVRGEAGARVLKEEPLDPQELKARHGRPVAPRAELDERLGDPRGAHAERLAPRIVELHVEPHAGEAARPQAIEEPRALEGELQPLGRVEAEEAAPRRDAAGGGQVVGGEPEVVAPSDADTDAGALARELVRREAGGDAAEAVQGERGGRGRLDLAPRGQPGEEARRVAPGVPAVAAAEDDGERERRPRSPAERLDHPPVARQHAGGGDPPVAEGIVRRRVAAG